MDYILLNWVQNITPQSWDWFFSWFSLLGRFEIITLFVVLFLWILYKRFENVILGMTWYGLGLVIEFLTKNWFTHPAPPLTLNRTINVLNLPGIEILYYFLYLRHQLANLFSQNGKILKKPVQAQKSAGSLGTSSKKAI